MKENKKTKTITIRVSDVEHMKITSGAREMGMTITQYINYLAHIEYMKSLDKIMIRYKQVVIMFDYVSKVCYEYNCFCFLNEELSDTFELSSLYEEDLKNVVRRLSSELDDYYDIIFRFYRDKDFYCGRLMFFEL